MGCTGAKVEKPTRLHDGALHAVRGKRVRDAIDLTDALDADAVVSARLGQAVVRGRLARPHARILHGRAVEADAVLN